MNNNIHGLIASICLLAIVAQSQAADGEFKDFVQAIPGSTVKFEMVAIPAGQFKVNNTNSTINRFWIGKYEVTWNEFVPYGHLGRSEIIRFGKNRDLIDKDGISHPSEISYPGAMSTGSYNKGKWPAFGISYLCAETYCKWLSKRTGRHYRLPTEIEWEYACRAGSTAAYFWGDDSTQANEYGWFKENSEGNSHPVGKLKPNKFGLYDIVGNLGEWCAKNDPQARPVLRGGAFTEDVNKLRSDSRIVETDEWIENDPLSPQGVWFLPAADFTGIRVVCEETNTNRPSESR